MRTGLAARARALSRTCDGVTFDGRRPTARTLVSGLIWFGGHRRLVRFAHLPLDDMMPAPTRALLGLQWERVACRRPLPCVAASALGGLWLTRFSIGLGEKVKVRVRARMGARA